MCLSSHKLNYNTKLNLCKLLLQKLKYLPTQLLKQRIYVIWGKIKQSQNPIISLHYIQHFAISYQPVNFSYNG
jgi:hypothetical protein